MTVEDFRSVLDALDQPVTVLDSNLRFLYVNPRAIGNTGMAYEDWIGKSPRELFPGFEQTTTWKLMKDTLEHQRPNEVVESIQLPKGDPHWHKSHFYFRDGKVFTLTYNITELKWREAELEQFNHLVSHDMSEPINTILGYADILTNLDLPSHPQLDVVLQGLKNSALRLKSNLGALVTFNELDKETEKAQVDLKNTCEDVVASLKALVEESDAQIELPSSSEEVSFTKGHLALVLQNLIQNGIRYSKPDTTPHVSISFDQDHVYHIVRVKDRGIGIASEHLDRVFEAFARLHNRREYEGTGMGLAVCKRIVTMNGGTIWIESEEGQGTTVLFTIPKATQS